MARRAATFRLAGTFGCRPTQAGIRTVPRRAGPRGPGWAPATGGQQPREHDMATASSRGPALRGKGLGRGMTGSIGSFVVRRARLVLVAAMLAVVGFGVLGFGAFSKLTTGGFQDPGAGSTTAQTLTDQRFGGSVGVILLVHAEAGTVDDASARAAGAESASRLAAGPARSSVGPQLRHPNTALSVHR